MMETQTAATSSTSPNEAAKVSAITRVRLALPSDEEELMAQCRRLHEENGLMQISEAKVREKMQKAFCRDGAIIGVIGEPGKIEASIFLEIGQIWYSDEWFLEELFSHVLPEYRRSTNARDLITFAKNCADNIGIPLVIGVLSNERTAAKVRLYERQLSKPSGAFFLYGRRTGQHSNAI